MGRKDFFQKDNRSYYCNILSLLNACMRKTRAIGFPIQRVSFPTNGVETIDMTRQSL
jgi:hypothetical protein